MKSVRTVLLFTCLLILASAASVLAQKEDSTSDQLKGQIRRLEASSFNPALSVGTKIANQRLLEETRLQLQVLLQRRHDALRMYLSSSGLSIKEAPAIESSIDSLEAQIKQLSEDVRQNRARLASLMGSIDGFSKGGASRSNPKKESVISHHPEPDSAASKESTEQDQVIDASRGKITGEQRRGPATITVKNINPVRYDNQLEETVSFPQAPDLTLPFIPPIPTSSPQATPKPASQGAGTKAGFAATDVRSTEADQITDAFNDILRRLEHLETHDLPAVQSKVLAASDAVNGAVDKTTQLVGASDSIINSGGPPALMSAIGPVVTSINYAIGGGGSAGVSWPDTEINNREADVNSLKNDLNTLPSKYSQGWSVWYDGGNKLSYDYVKTRLEELANVLKGMDRTSPSFTTFGQAQSKLRLWQPILSGVTPSSFYLSRTADCNFSFNTGKNTIIRHFKRDRSVPNPTPQAESEVTVICSSPISVSAGVGFSFVDEREFGFIQSRMSATDPTVVQRFGFTSRSRFRPIPAILLNTRFYEPNDIIAFHGSVGAVVDVKTGQGGTDLEFIIGPSISLMRTLFITPGVHIARVPELAGGFQVGDQVPSGVSAPPIQKSWKSGFMTTFTYKIR